MNKKRTALALISGMGALFLAMHKQAVASGNVSEAGEVYARAQRVISRNGLNADPLMVTAMAKIESAFDPSAVRIEPHLNDSSVGLMQTLQNTAQWLARDFPKYGAYGIPSYSDLLNPDISIYFGACYIDYLSNYRGIPRSEDWIVESYNGGPGNSNSMTRNHLAKYKKAKEEVKGAL